MAILHNRISQKELKQRLLEENIPRRTLSFYRYFPISDPEIFRNELYLRLSELQVFGRIYLAHEGINAQISVPVSMENQLRDYLASIGPLRGLRLNTAFSDDGKSFWVLKIGLLGSSFVNNFNEFGRQYKTYIMADAPYRMKPSDLSQFYIRDPLGNMVPLATLATVRDTVGPLYTNRFNLYRSAEISGSPAPGYSSHRHSMPWVKQQKNLWQKESALPIVTCRFQEKAAEGRVDLFLLWRWFLYFLFLRHNTKAGACPSAFCSARRGQSWERCLDCFWPDLVLTIM